MNWSLCFKVRRKYCLPSIRSIGKLVIPKNRPPFSTDVTQETDKVVFDMPFVYHCVNHDSGHQDSSDMHNYEVHTLLNKTP